MGKILKNPLAIDLFCGLGGWSDGLLAEGYDVVGFDIERHVHGEHRYPSQLVIQDVLTLHGSQLVDAALIVASPPCQKFSYMAMPWSRSKELARWYRDPEHPMRLAELTKLFDVCFILQEEASEAAGRHIPLVVENVRGARDWVGPARWNFGSFYLWGDVPALMPTGRKFKSWGMNWSDQTLRGQDFTRIAGRQTAGTANGTIGRLHMDGIKGISHRPSGHWTNPAEHEGIKTGGGSDGWFGNNDHPLRQGSSNSNSRKAASAMIAKIPLVLSRHIGATYRPR